MTDLTASDDLILSLREAVGYALNEPLYTNKDEIRAVLDRLAAAEAEVERLQDQVTEVPTLCRRYEAQIAALTAERDRLAEEVERLRNLLATYIEVAPAFRSKPSGGEGSQAREQQRAHIALEDTVRAAIRGDSDEG